MKRGRKVVCGSQEGVLDIFDYSDIEDISDRFPGHPASVDALLALDDDIVMTGSSDGLIRIISILPNKMLGVVGQHSDWPVERLACSADGLLLASAVRAPLAFSVETRPAPASRAMRAPVRAVARQHGEALGDRLPSGGCRCGGRA